MRSDESIVRDALEWGRNATEGSAALGRILSERGSERGLMLDLQARAEAAEEALTMLRDAWNAHMETCPDRSTFRKGPTLEEIEAWKNAPSGTASGRREQLEADRLARKHVVERGEIGFTYRPTPPSGPPPEQTSHEMQDEGEAL